MDLLEVLAGMFSGQGGGPPLGGAIPQETPMSAPDPTMMPGGDAMAMGGDVGGGVPLPRPRPPIPLTPPSGPPPGDMAAAAGGGMPPGPAPAGPGGGIATALGLDREAVGSIARSLAAGMSGVGSSPFAGQSFANSMGAALGGGNKYEDDQDARRVGALDRAMKMRLQEGNLKIGQQNADSLTALRKSSMAKPGAWNKNPAQLMLDAERRVLRFNEQVNNEINRQNRDTPLLTAEDRAKRIAEGETKKQAYRSDLYKRLGLPADAAAPGAGAEGPARPASKEEYDALPSGTPFIDPEGNTRTKP